LLATTTAIARPPLWAAAARRPARTRRDSRPRHAGRLSRAAHHNARCAYSHIGDAAARVCTAPCKRAGWRGASAFLLAAARLAGGGFFRAALGGLWGAAFGAFLGSAFGTCGRRRGSALGTFGAFDRHGLGCGCDRRLRDGRRQHGPHW